MKNQRTIRGCPLSGVFWVLCGVWLLPDPGKEVKLCTFCMTVSIRGYSLWAPACLCNAGAGENEVCNFILVILGLIFIHMNYSKL